MSTGQSPFRNTYNYYIGVRHAESTANAERVIITHPEDGINYFHLYFNFNMHSYIIFVNNDCKDATDMD